MKRIYIFICLALSVSVLNAQDGRRKDKEARREERRQKTSAIIKQEEEGVLVYHKQNIFGISLRTNGYGFFYEHGRMKSPRFTNLYSFELTEIMHPKEEKLNTSAQGYFGNSFKYGKINNFYQAKFGFGQQYIFGQKGNKNGIAVLGIYKGGLSVGLMKPYYLNVEDASGIPKDIKYRDDSTTFVSWGSINGSSGLGKGWSEIKINPGIYAKTGLRFDFGAYNESITAIEVGLSVDAYAKKVEQMVYNKPRQLFFQGHIAIIFGGRK